jgi:hypothetical protein
VRYGTCTGPFPVLLTIIYWLSGRQFTECVALETTQFLVEIFASAVTDAGKAYLKILIYRTGPATYYWPDLRFAVIRRSAGLVTPGEFWASRTEGGQAGPGRAFIRLSSSNPPGAQTTSPSPSPCMAGSDNILRGHAGYGAEVHPLALAEPGGDHARANGM